MLNYGISVYCLPQGYCNICLSAVGQDTNCHTKHLLFKAFVVNVQVCKQSSNLEKMIHIYIYIYMQSFKKL